MKGTINHGPPATGETIIADIGLEQAQTAVPGHDAGDKNGNGPLAGHDVITHESAGTAGIGAT